MKNKDHLQKLVDGVIDLIHSRNWSTLSRQTCRMRKQKMLNPKSPNDIVRLVAATVYIIRTRGKSEDFEQLTSIFHRWLSSFYSCPIDELTQFLDDAAEEEKRHFFHII